MMFTLVRKLLRDVRLPLLILILLTAAFQCLWIKVAQRISGDSGLLRQLVWLGEGRGVTPGEIEKEIFEGPGKIIKTMIGGDRISLFRVTDVLTIGFVHSVVLTILCLWAVGRGAGAIAGEIDRGTMELLLAQPLARFRVILAHFIVDVVTIPLLSLSIWAGQWIAIPLLDVREVPARGQKAGVPIDPAVFGPAIWNVAALVFAISGYTMWLSSRGRFRGRVLGVAILITLLQYLINVIGQLWDVLAPLRPFTVFYYYQPQQIILNHKWSVEVNKLWSGADWGAANEVLFSVNVLLVLFLVGFVGYALAFWKFSQRDLPAPL
jgi:ABC-2 type transport system permease protein